MVAFGIDLGTANIRGAWLDGMTLRFIEEPGGGISIPAVVSFQAGEPRIGRAALAQAAANPDSTVRGLKRWLGRSVEDLDATSSPYTLRKVVAGSGGHALVRMGTRMHELDAMLGALLRGVADLAEHQTGARPKNVVLTIPRWLEPGGEMVLREAAALARLTVDEIVDEAVATTLTLPEPQSGADRPIAVVDVGAGGVNVAIVELAPGRATMLSSVGDGTVGGDDIDVALAEVILDQVPLSSGGRWNDPRSTEMARRMAETMKRDLSLVPEVTAIATFLPGAPSVTLERTQLDVLLGGLLGRIDGACTAALLQARLSPDGLSAVYLTGGMAEVPAVRERVHGNLHRELMHFHRAGGAPALGAAILSALRRSEVRPTVSIRATPAGRDALPEPASSMQPDSGPWSPAEVRDGVAASGARYRLLDAPSSYLRPAKPSCEPPRSSDQPNDSLRPIVSGPLPRVGPPAPSLPPDGLTLRSFAHSPDSSTPALGEPTSEIKRFIRPADAQSLFNLAITRPVSPCDLEPMTLPVLFLRTLSRQRMSGMLTLARAGSAADLRIIEGRAHLFPEELERLAQTFLWPEGTYTFNRGDFALDSRPCLSMVRVAASGLRTLIHSFPPEELEGALSANLDLAPVVRIDALRIVARLGLGGAQARLVARLDGALTARHLLRGATGPAATLELLFLLSLLDAIEWTWPRPSTCRSLADLVDQAARRMLSGSYFDALGVHWNAGGEEIEAAYRALAAKLAPEGEWDAAAPAACEKMRERVDTAYYILREPTFRRAHRVSEHPKGFFEDESTGVKRAV